MIHGQADHDCRIIRYSTGKGEPVQVHCDPWVGVSPTGSISATGKGIPPLKPGYAIFWKVAAALLFLGLVFGKAGYALDLFEGRPKKSTVPSLYELFDEGLQTRVLGTVFRDRSWKRLCRQKKMAVGVVDLSGRGPARFARINGESMMYAASLPKIGILLAGAQALEDGILKETPDVLADMRCMIARSDNHAATRMIDRLGFKGIARVLMDPRYRLYDPLRGGGLWVGKRYAADGPRLPDPLMGISHAASATQICRFFYMLYTGRLVSSARSHQMLEMLSDPEIHHKFVHVLEKRAAGARLFRKSGTWKQWHSDAVMVWGPERRRYIAVALVDDPRGEAILRKLIAALDDELCSDAADPGPIARDGRPALPEAAGSGEPLPSKTLRGS